MNPFVYVRPRDEREAAKAAADRDSIYIAGGTTVVDLMRINVLEPRRLIDVSKLPLDGVSRTTTGIRIGAMARMSDVAEQTSDYPAIRQSLLLAASPQLRNMATIGGNLMQRTRCAYFRDIDSPCNKRNPGSGCAALQGENRTMAVLGTSDRCIATYPGDLAVALCALDALVHVLRPDGTEKSIPIREFYVSYGEDPARETVLDRGELITAVEVTATAMARNSRFVKVRDRASYEFALASCAVGLDTDGNTIRDASVALGGIATKPWHSSEAEGALRSRPANLETFQRAADAALQGARAYDQNGFKIELAKRTLVRALDELVPTEKK